MENICEMQIKKSAQPLQITRFQFLIIFDCLTFFLKSTDYGQQSTVYGFCSCSRSPSPVPILLHLFEIYVSDVVIAVVWILSDVRILLCAALCSGVLVHLF